MAKKDEGEEAISLCMESTDLNTFCRSTNEVGMKIEPCGLIDASAAAASPFLFFCLPYTIFTIKGFSRSSLKFRELVQLTVLVQWNPRVAISQRCLWPRLKLRFLQLNDPLSSTQAVIFYPTIGKLLLAWKLDYCFFFFHCHGSIDIRGSCGRLHQSSCAMW